MDIGHWILLAMLLFAIAMLVGQRFENIEKGHVVSPKDGPLGELYITTPSETGLVCRHCHGRYNFGHCPNCLYDSYWKQDRRRAKIAHYVELLETLLKVRDPIVFNIPENKKFFEEDKMTVHYYLGIE